MPTSKNLALAALLPLVYLMVCALLGAGLAYPLYLLTGGSDASWLRTLVSRGGQAFLLLGLYPLWRAVAPAADGFGIGPGFRRQAALGFGLGVLMLGLHTLLLVGLDIRMLKPAGWPGVARWAAILFNAFTAGLLVALMEETLFRGALFGLLRTRAGAAAAAIISSLYFAALHFLGSRLEEDPAAIDYGTAFRIALDAFAHFGSLPGDSFLGLFLAGLLLASVRALVPRGIGYCYGLHAGWVFVIKAAKPLTQPVPDAPLGFLVGSYDRFVGYLSAAWVAALIAALLLWARRQRFGTRPLAPAGREPPP